MRGSGLACAALAALAGAAEAQEESNKASNVAGEIVVTATRSEEDPLEVPASVASQSFDELRLLGFTYGSEEFRGVPGVFVRRGEGDGDEFLFVSIRGSSGTEGYLALIDGVPFLGPDEEPLLNQVPYDALERVEIVKGPVSALYGRGGLYGAVNYITRSPRDDGAALNVVAGSDDYYRGLAMEQRATSWLTGRASFEFYDDYQVTQDNSLETGAYQLVNLGATIAPRGWSNSSLELALTNALDAEYHFHFGGRSAATLVTPGVPRQFRATLRASF